MNTKTGSHVRRRALIVEDDDFQRELLKELLGQLDWSDIVSCATGAEALQKLKGVGSTAFDLILLDLHMPGMDGFEFMGQLDSAGYRGAAIIVSGQSTDVLRSAGLVAQLRRFQLLGVVAKPVQKSALGALLAVL